MAALNKVQKAEIASQASKIRQGAKALVGEAEQKVKNVQAKLRDANEGRKTEALIGAVAGAGGAVVASQVHRELAVKRGRTGLGYAINIGGGLLGGALIQYSKPQQSGMRIGGDFLIGMAIGQVALALADKDLVPGFNS